MSKINLTDATTLTNETSFVSTLNTNFATIETESDNFLSLDGTSPNSMSADLDMDSNRILNLPTPTAATEPLRLQDLSDFTGGGTITAGAPVTASYVTLGTNSTLTSERVLTAGTGITLTDAGAGSTLTIATTQAPITTSASLIAILTDETGTGAAVFGTSPTIGTPTLTNPTVTTGAFNAPVLTSATITTKISPTTDDGAPLGDTTHNFSDLFLASGAVVNWNAGDVTLTHSANLLAFAGASSGYTFDAVIKPSANDAAALGVSGTAWSDIFLASGAVINFNAGDVTCTHSAGALTFFNTNFFLTGTSSILTGTAIPAGGFAGSGYKLSSTSNFGIFFGSSTPTLAAAQGSLYLRSDGSSTTTRMYVNTNGSTTWTAVSTVA